MTTRQQHHTTDADPAVKARLRAVWTLGDYPRVARELVAPLGPALVEACGVAPGMEVLDVAAGAGNASLPAARAGARVTACDLTPALLDAGQRAAIAAGTSVDWVEGDAEDLPFLTGSFAAVISTVGVMFAPSHRRAAGELLRVCAPGGTIGLIAWTPEGFVGQMLDAMRPFAPPPPPGAQPPPLWGDEAHVAALLGDGATIRRAERRLLRVDRFAAPDALRTYFRAFYGPTRAVYRHVGDDPDRVEALDRALDDVAARFRGADGGMEWEYLLVVARRRR